MLKQRLKEIITIVEESGIAEVEISSWWGRKIRVAKYAGSAVAQMPAAAPVQPAQTASQVAYEPPPPEPEPAPGERHAITAPIVGTFYRAPSPESQPYITVGDKITKGQTICIIEAMKIMNEIDSDVTGTVVEILMEDANPVEYNQPLVVVDPS